MYSRLYKIPSEPIPFPHVPQRPASAPPSTDSSVNPMTPMMVVTPYGHYILMQTNSCLPQQMVPIAGTVPLPNPQQFITAYTTTSPSFPSHPPLSTSTSVVGGTSSERSVDHSPPPISVAGHKSNTSGARLVNAVCSTHRRNPHRSRCVCVECHTRSAPPRFSPARDIFGSQNSNPTEADFAGSYYVVGGEIIFDPPLDLSKVDQDRGSVMTATREARDVPSRREFQNIDEGVQTPVDWLAKDPITATSQTPCAWEGGPAVKPSEPLPYCAGSCPTSVDLGLKQKYRKKWCCTQCKSERKKEKEFKKLLAAAEDNKNCAISPQIKLDI